MCLPVPSASSVENVPLSMEYPFEKDVMETKPTKNIFLLKTVQSYKVEQTSPVPSEAFKGDDIIRHITFFCSWLILLEHWPMFLNYRQALSEFCPLLLHRLCPASEILMFPLFINVSVCLCLCVCVCVSKTERRRISTRSKR